MKTGKEILDSVLKTTQMGQVGIRAVKDYAVKAELKAALQDQLGEYNAIEREVSTIAASRGWEMKDLDPMAKLMSRMYAQTNLSFGHADSKIAAMMVQGNTRGMIKGLKNLHHANNADSRVVTIAQRLLDCETANIKQMQGYL